jgi:hypothetical protein
MNQKRKHIDIRVEESLWHASKMALVERKQTFQAFLEGKLKQLVRESA